jgi:hypothetical protein
MGDASAILFPDNPIDPGGLVMEGDPDADVLGIGARGRQPGGKKGGPAPNPSADALAEISRRMFEQTDPLRTNLIGRSENFLNGGMDVTGTPQYLSMKNAADVQFQKARDNTIARTAAGGALTDALAGLESDRANFLTQGAGDIADTELNRAFGLATGLLPGAGQGLGQAAAIQAQQIQAQQAQQAAGKQAAGTGVGIILASMLS